MQIYLLMLLMMLLQQIKSITISQLLNFNRFSFLLVFTFVFLLAHLTLLHPIAVLLSHFYGVFFLSYSSQWGKSLRGSMTKCLNVSISFFFLSFFRGNKYITWLSKGVSENQPWVANQLETWLAYCLGITSDVSTSY